MNNLEKELAILQDDLELLRSVRSFRIYASHHNKAIVFDRLDWLAYLGLFETEVFGATIFNYENP